MNGTPSSANSAACRTIASRPSGVTIPMSPPPASATEFTCAWSIAPGWNVVIWLPSVSVVMNA